MIQLEQPRPEILASLLMPVSMITLGAVSEAFSRQHGDGLQLRQTETHMEIVKPAGYVQRPLSPLCYGVSSPFPVKDRLEFDFWAEAEGLTVATPHPNIAPAGWVVLQLSEEWIDKFRLEIEDESPELCRSLAAHLPEASVVTLYFSLIDMEGERTAGITSEAYLICPRGEYTVVELDKAVVEAAKEFIPDLDLDEIRSAGIYGASVLNP